MAENNDELDDNKIRKIYEDDAIVNFKMGYNCLFDDYRQQITRLHNADQKTNMFFVFNVAIIALLTVVFPLNTGTNKIFIYSIVLLILFAVSMIATIITIIISLYPKGSKYLSNDEFVSADFYNRSTEVFMGDIMRQLNISINELHGHIEKKMLCIKIISIETILNIIIVFALIFLRLF